MFKTVLSMLFFGLFFGVSAHAAHIPELPQALITKVNRTGYIMVDYKHIQTCHVYPHRVVVTDEYGDPAVTMRQVFVISLSQNIYKLIDAASKEELQVSNTHICDAPTTSVTAEAPNVPSFSLYESGACSTPRSERVGGHSANLRNIIDRFCPETYGEAGQ